MRIAINGFGRIGRQVFRILWEAPELEVVHINDLADAETLAHLLAYDSTYGAWDHDVYADEGAIKVDDTRVAVTKVKDPAKLPWREREVSLVLESSGAFRKREQAMRHVEAGAERVLVSAPGKDQLDGDFVIGINEDRYDPGRHQIVSIGSCTTNCLAIIAHVLHAELELVRGFATAIHAYTASQNLLDAPHRDLRRARSAATNLIPTSTGAASAIGAVLPELDGRIDAVSVRVPVACGSLLDLTCQVGQATAEEDLFDMFRHWEAEHLTGVLQVEEAPLVSSDIVGNPSSAILIPEDVRVLDENLIKVLAWYDNECGFSHRVVDMLRVMAA